jgi:hypothetical protein
MRVEKQIFLGVDRLARLWNIDSYKVKLAKAYKHFPRAELDIAPLFSPQEWVKIHVTNHSSSK